MRAGGGTLVKRSAAPKLPYDVAAGRGFVPASPATPPTPSDVKASDAQWLSPRALRPWRNVGLGPMPPGGPEGSGVAGLVQAAGDVTGHLPGDRPGAGAVGEAAGGGEAEAGGQVVHGTLPLGPAAHPGLPGDADLALDGLRGGRLRCA